MSKLYIVKRNIWHTGENLYYFPAGPGEAPTVADMGHLPQDRLDTLVQLGIIEPAPAEKARKSSKESE